MEKNKKNKIIGLSIGILVVLIIVVSSTYAYWQITRTQETPNDIVAACLNLDLKDASTENTGINLDSAWPISDEEGKKLTGYTFTVTNNCNEEINYIVGLNRVEEENYLQDSSIKLQLDDNSSFTYGDLSDVEYVDPDNTEYTARSSKQVSVETISAKGTNTHTIRVWVSSDAPVSEQSKTFLGQVFITGGQGIEKPKECFAIADNGTITGYNYECGTEVVVPAEINGIQVKNISQASFANGNILMYALYNEETKDSIVIHYYTETIGVEDFINSYIDRYCSNPGTCTLEDLEEEGHKIVVTQEEFNGSLAKYEAGGYVVTTIRKNYFDVETKEYDMEPRALITSLDLSNTIYLETIGKSAFRGGYYSDIMIGDNCIVNDTSGAAYYCYGNLEKITFPKNGNIIIENEAFWRNRITEITIPSSVTAIGVSAFSENLISSLVFEDTDENPSQLNEIKYQAFENNKLSKIVIPASVTSIEDYAFSSNPSLAEVIIKNTEGNVTVDSTAFPSATQVTYNPNYTE